MRIMGIKRKKEILKISALLHFPTFRKKVKAQQTKIIVLDGCPINCAEKILGKEGITDITHINTTDFDIVKGKTPFTKEKANEIVEHIKNLSIN